ncbi:MAG: LysR family transcriptional regulator [Pseudomonadota bacterium]|nr:LysR family transcriptional regulator [Pseudomonadota bacterium]
MSLSTDMLAAFSTVTEQLSISGAARVLGLPKSVVSKRLAQLEDSVGAALLTRSTRRMSLTPAGTLYLAFARRALAAVDEARESLRTLRTELSGLIRVSAPVAWGQRVLGPLLPAFLAAHEGLEVELVLSDRVMDLAYERIDLALRMSAASTPDLVTIPLVRLDWGLCAAPSYLASSGVPDGPAALEGHRCLSYWRDRRQDRWSFSAGARRVTVQVGSRYRANHPEAVADAAVAGLGIALLPLYFVEREIAAARLVRVLPDWTPRTEFGDAVCVVALPDRIRFARNQALLQFLRAQVARPG